MEETTNTPDSEATQQVAIPTVEQIDVEVWDDDATDDIDMKISIYKGSSSNDKFRSIRISEDEAKQILDRDGVDLYGFTEWMTGSYLLTMELPDRIRVWATQTIAEYINVAPQDLHDIVRLVWEINKLEGVEYE